MNKIRFVSLIIGIFFSLTMNADDYTFVVGENILKEYASANAVFTAESDCKVIIETHEVFSVVYDGKECEYSYVPGSGYAYRYEVDGVKGGTSISISSGFVMNSGKVKVSVMASGEKVPVEITNIIPTKGSKFAWHTSGIVTVNFNRSITISGIKLVAGEYSADVDDVRLGNSLSFNLSNALNSALKDGKIQPGDMFRICVKGLRDAADTENMYNGTGELDIDFMAPHPQNEFVKASVGDAQLSYMTANTYNFLSYYVPDGSDGLFVVEFSGDIKSVDNISMTMGNLDLDSSGKYHHSSLPYTIKGNKLYIDARGKLRTLAVLFPAVVDTEAGEEGETESGIGTYDTEHVTITITNAVDVNGNSFLSALPGSVGSYSFTMNYVEIIDEAYIDGDNKPEGADVKSGETVSLWLSNADIKFKGIEVAYFVPAQSTDENEEVKQEQETKIVTDFSEEKDPLEGKVISFVMPEMKNVIAGSVVRVALHDASSTDGMPHYLYIEYKAAEDANSISGMNVRSASDDIYTLGGVKVNKMTKGVYIRGGKKVVRG